MPALDLGYCRARTCRKQILWAKTEKGKAIPLDPRPACDDGNVVLVGERRIARVFKDAKAARAYQFLHGGDGPYISHFATCVARRKFRKAAA